MKEPAARNFTVVLTKDELTILKYVMNELARGLANTPYMDRHGSVVGDPLKDTYELGDDQPDDPYASLKTLIPKINKLKWPG